jgi:hypothetical protein
MDEVLKQLMENLESVIETLSSLAPHVWAVYVMQVRVEAVQWLLWGVFVGLLIIPAVKVHRWVKGEIEKKEGGDDDDDGLFFAVFLVSACAVVGLAASSLHHLLLAVGRFINPNYYVIKSLLDIISKGD